jgi:hypothetical protein
MWDAGMKPGGRSRCYCGASIDIASIPGHVRAAVRDGAGIQINVPSAADEKVRSPVLRCRSRAEMDLPCSRFRSDHLKKSAPGITPEVRSYTAPKSVRPLPSSFYIGRLSALSNYRPYFVRFGIIRPSRTSRVTAFS